MKCKVLHESARRIRVHIEYRALTPDEADRLEYYLRGTEGVLSAKFYDRTGDAVICHSGDPASVRRALAAFSPERTEVLVPENTGRALNAAFEEKLVTTIALRALRRLLIPAPVRCILTAVHALPHIAEGLRALLRGRADVSVLDATAIGVSVLRGDFETASSIMFLLRIGGILDEWTHKKAVADLARTMALNVDRVWVRTAEGQEVLVPIGDVRAGDTVVVRTGSMIPLDGKVIGGEAMVNQASITGEPLPVRRCEGGYVYAGTVVEEGECVLLVDKTAGSGRYDRIVRMIEESEKLKSATEDKASHLADALVPYSLGATALTWLLTRNPAKALSILMVDFSCALKLSMPIAVLSAMREAGRSGITVKGGRFLEAVSEADTIVFDKTGTLTHAAPRVAMVAAFNGQDEAEMLRLAACLEEHYPHSMARAVVEEAERRGLQHEERHSRVEYIVAHGISSTVDGVKAVIGSRHFVFEDEGCVLPPEEQARFDALPDEYSQLYLAIGGVLSAVICIEDPIRDEAAEVIRSLRELGFRRIVMMTGDSERTAAAVAAAVGMDGFFAEVLPEDKAAFIRAEHEAGRRVVMLGDGVNDSPALSEADAGIAIRDGAAIAREVADITIAADDLHALTRLKRVSDALMARIRSNYRFIMSFNALLIVLGVVGVLPPATSALLHNASTIAIGLKSMTDLLPEE